MKAKRSIERDNQHVRGKHNNVTNVNVTVHTADTKSKRKPKVDPKAIQALNERAQKFNELKQLAVTRNIALPARIGNLDINPNQVKSTEAVQKVTDVPDDKIKDMEDVFAEAIKANANLAYEMTDARLKQTFPSPLQSPVSVTETATETANTTANDSPMKPSALPEQRNPLVYSRTYRDHSLDTAPEFTSEETGRSMRRRVLPSISNYRYQFCSKVSIHAGTNGH